MNFWQFFWLIVWSFLFIAYLMVLFQILTDLFRDRDLSGGWKALWIVLLIVFPLLTALVYLVARGKGMADRQTAAVEQAKADTDAYIRRAAGTKAPAEEIATAKSLLDAGAISPEEFERLKAKALAA